MVKDLIAGFFIVAENQFNIGDKIQIGKLEGEVNKMIQDEDDDLDDVNETEDDEDSDDSEDK